MTKQNICIIILLALSLAGITGCEEPVVKNNSSKKNQISPGNPDAPTPDYNGRYPGQFGYHKPEWPQEIRKEIYGDPEIFSTPRVQFTAELAGDKIFPKNTGRHLWSMRLDGSDRRLVADPTLLSDNLGLTHAAIRSPNNRYLALSYRDENDKPIRAILDLKTQSKWTIADGGGRPNFIWTKDSNNLIFYSERNHYNYHLPTKTLTNRKPIYASTLFLLPDNKKFISFRSNSYELYDFEGGKLKEIEFDFPPSGGAQYPIISPDGEIIYFNVRGTIHGVRIETGEIIRMFKSSTHKVWRSKPTFSIENRLVYFFDCCSAKIFDLEYLKRESIPLDEIRIWSMSKTGQFTIFNTTHSETNKRHNRK